MKKLLPIIITVAIAIISCQKEISDFTALPTVNTPMDSCRIERSYSYGGSGGINDSANYFYTGERLTSVISERADVLYAYNGDKLISMHYYEKPGNLLYHVDSFYYANDTILTKIIAHDYDMYNHFDTIHSVLNFNYTGNRLTQLVTVDRYEGYTDTDTLTSVFRWTNDNVSSIFFTSSYWGEDSIYYDYDNNPNYFNAKSKYFFMMDPFFQLHVGFDPHLPYFISKNNVTNFRIYGNIDYPVSYETDSLSHPTLVSQGGFEYMGYKWFCP